MASAGSIRAETNRSASSRITRHASRFSFSNPLTNPEPLIGTRNPPAHHWLLAVLLAGGATLAGMLALWGAAYLYTTAAHLPAGPDAMKTAGGETPLATVLYARGGTEIARYYRENRTWTPYRRIGKPVREALVATEDRRFYRHGGVDWRRLVGATWQTLRGDRQGASTITMQFVRNRYSEIADDPPYRRKVKEVLMAMKLEDAFSKKHILEAYLNTVPFGHGAFGIGAAAQTYFDTTAAALGPARAALLVGMLKGPTRYSPKLHPERATARRNVVLRQMHKRGFLSERRLRRLQGEPLLLDRARPSLDGSPAPFFAEAVRRRVERWAAANGYDLYTDGLRVHTTLDLSMQRMAQAAVRTQAEKLEAVAAYEWSRSNPRLLSENVAPYVRRAERESFAPVARLWEERPALARDRIRRTARYRRALRRGADSSAALRRLRSNAAFMDSLRRRVARLQAGLVAMTPRTGAVRAWVGGRDFAADQYDKVGLAQRQPGSTFKPFVWTAALNHGYAPYDAMRGGALPDPYDARRVGDGGGLTLRNGLAYSSNRMALALAREVGPDAVARTARRLGIESELRAVPSLALGTSEVTLLEMTAAYVTIAAGGRRAEPRLVTRIASADGNPLAQFTTDPRSTGERALARAPAHTMLDMMRGVVDRGTGAPLRAGWQVQGADLAGKTGTTQNNADGWFLAMHPRLVVGAWTGFNDRRVAFRTEHWGHGSSNALRLVGSFLENVLAAHPSWAEARFEPPPGYRRPEKPRAGAPLDSAYAGYETVGDAYGANPGATDHRLRDAVGEGLDSARYDRVPARSADPEAALRRDLPARADSVQQTPPSSDAPEGAPSGRPAPVQQQPPPDEDDDASSRSAPAPVGRGELEERPRPRRDDR
jgi:penicillin-binding protein 1A